MCTAPFPPFCAAPFSFLPCSISSSSFSYLSPPPVPVLLRLVGCRRRRRFFFFFCSFSVTVTPASRYASSLNRVRTNEAAYSLPRRCIRCIMDAEAHEGKMLLMPGLDVPFVSRKQESRAKGGGRGEGKGEEGKLDAHAKQSFFA